jgi:FkbM family methyltransferase
VKLRRQSEQDERARRKDEIRAERARQKAEARAEREHVKEELRARKAVREAALDAVAEHTRTVEADWDGLKFMVDTSDRGIGRQLFATGLRPEFSVLERTLALLQRAGAPVAAERSVFVDVGANIGTASLAAVHRHGFLRALACEPNPRSRQLLRMSLVRNELSDRVLVAPEAISDQAGEAHLALVPDSPGRDHLAEQGPDTTTVATATLDSVLARFGLAPEEVGLMWIDVQGFEAEVLRGAASVLALRRPIVFEYRPTALRERGTLERLAQALAGYETFIDLRQKHELPTDLETVTAQLDSLPRFPHTDLLAF